MGIGVGVRVRRMEEVSSMLEVGSAWGLGLEWLVRVVVSADR